MPQQSTGILGQNATTNGTTITIDLSDFKDDDDNQILNNPATATDNQKIAAFNAGVASNARPFTYANGKPIVDETNVLVRGKSKRPKSFEKREEEVQVKHEFVLDVHTKYKPKSCISDAI